jgi:hypothetical protein
MHANEWGARRVIAYAAAFTGRPKEPRAENRAAAAMGLM